MRVLVIVPAADENCEKKDSSCRTSVHACRLCLDTETALYCIHNLHLADKICFLTGIMVSKTDKLPQHICRCCYYLLQKFFAFKDRSVNAHNILIKAFVMGQMITTDFIRKIDRASFKLLLPFVTTKGAVDCLNKDYADEPLFKEKDIKQENISMGSQKPQTNIAAFSAQSYTRSFSKSFTNVHFTQVEPLLVKKPNYVYSYSDTKEKVFTADLQNDPSLLDADNKKGVSKLETEETKIDYEDEDINDELSFGVDDCGAGTDDKKLLMPTLKINTETQIGNRKLVTEDKTYLEKYQNNKIKLRDQLSEKKQSKKKRVQKVLKHKNSKVLKRPKRKGLHNLWLECEKEKIRMAKKYDVEIRLFNKKEQIEQLELRKQSKSYSKRPYKCDTCFMAFTFEKPYRVHLKLHDPSRGPVKCNICHYYYPSRRHFSQHVNIHKANFTCNKCGHVTNKWYIAKRHYLWHNGLKFKCKYCSKTFDCRSTYYVHVRLAHATLHDSCHICGEVYLGAAGLRTHFQKSHAQLYVPSASEEQLKGDDARQTYLRSCKACGESFSDEDLFINHLKIHKKDFHCDLCAMSFVSAISLDIHKQRKHFNIVTYNEKTKKLTDGAQQEYICEKCGREFKHPSNFRRHYLVHTGKRFKCDICGKEMTTKVNVQVHIQTIHMGLPYPPRAKRNRKPDKRIKDIVH